MSTHSSSTRRQVEELSSEAKSPLWKRPFFLLATGVFLLAQAWGMGLLIVLICVPIAILVWVYQARVEDGSTASRSLTALWSLWKRPAAWLALGPVVLVWLFYFGAFWSISDRVLLVEHPKPFPGELVVRPEGLMLGTVPVDPLGPMNGWARANEHMWDGPLCIRVGPGTVHYIARGVVTWSSRARKLNWARATTPWGERAEVEQAASF